MSAEFPPAGGVTSVAGKTGAVTLVKGDVGLGNVDNTSDASKPVSTAQQAYVDSLLPWTVNINPTGTAATQTNWSTQSADSLQHLNQYVASTGVQNAERGWDVVLAAGTWTFELLHIKFSDKGIYTVSLDGSSVGTIDGYNSGVVYNTYSTITGITIASSGKKRLLLKMATKNASSTNYAGTATWLRFYRTA